MNNAFGEYESHSILAGGQDYWLSKEEWEALNRFIKTREGLIPQVLKNIKMGKRDIELNESDLRLFNLIGDKFIYANDKILYHLPFIIEEVDGKFKLIPLEHELTTSGMSFGQAITALKEGKKVSRVGWNGKGMFIFKQIPANIGLDIIPKMQSVPDSVKETMLKTQTNLNYRNQCVLVDAEGNVDNWSPSISDCFAEDWLINF